ncbi:hypothetical protein HDU67_006114, partial [Dinochytrium kinnereticum]
MPATTAADAATATVHTLATLTKQLLKTTTGKDLPIPFTRPTALRIEAPPPRMDVTVTLQDGDTIELDTVGSTPSSPLTQSPRERDRFTTALTDYKELMQAASSGKGKRFRLIEGTVLVDLNQDFEDVGFLAVKLE